MPSRYDLDVHALQSTRADAIGDRLRTGRSLNKLLDLLSDGTDTPGDWLRAAAVVVAEHGDPETSERLFLLADLTETLL